MNTREAISLAVEALKQMKGDDLYRAQCAFKGLPEKEMNSEHGTSGKTRQQILDEYQAHENKVNDAITALCQLGNRL